MGPAGGRRVLTLLGHARKENHKGCLQYTALIIPPNQNQIVCACAWDSGLDSQEGTRSSSTEIKRNMQKNNNNDYFYKE